MTRQASRRRGDAWHFLLPADQSDFTQPCAARVQPKGVRATVASWRRQNALGGPQVQELSDAWAPNVHARTGAQLHCLPEATCIQPTLSTNPHPYTKQQFEKLLGLYAYGFHVYRSGCHKPNYVDISLAQLVNYVATNPALKPVIESSSSVSLLGRHGADIAPDKACEFVNDFITSDR